jgi:hypothetical protein
MGRARIGVDTQFFPALQVPVRNLAEFVLLFGKLGDLRHGFEPDDAFDGQICLVSAPKCLSTSAS